MRAKICARPCKQAACAGRSRYDATQSRARRQYSDASVTGAASVARRPRQGAWRLTCRGHRRALRLPPGRCSGGGGVDTTQCMADVVIRGACVVDGTGAAAIETDVAIAGGRIVELKTGARADRVLDAGGLTLAPGFIDLHTHYDCQLFWDPHATPSPWHGVTTVVMGNCGFTIAPCRAADRETLMQLLLYVEGMPIETLRAGIRWQWEDFPGYLAALDSVQPGVNVGAFIGHSAVRFAVMGAAAVERAATGEERAQMAALVQAGVEAGALGWSTSLSPTHFFADSGAPAPSRVADEDELFALAEALRPFARGIIEVAPRTLLALSTAEEKAAEQQFFGRLAQASGKLVSWAPLLDNPFAPGSSLKLLDDAAALQAAGTQVVPQVGCRPLELRFDFHAPAFGLENNGFWRPVMALDREERRRRFATSEFRKSLERFEGGFVAALAPGWDKIVLRVPATERCRGLQDRSVSDIAAERNIRPIDAFLDVALEDDLRGQWGAQVLNGGEASVLQLLRHPAGVLALSDAGAHVDTLCDQGFTTYLLGHWVRERGLLGLEEAVRLVTDVPARRYGLAGRGRIAPGYAADLVLFDPRAIGTRPTELAHDLPRGQRRLLQRATGVEHVLVNGTPVVSRGVPTSDRPGRVLRGGA